MIAVFVWVGLLAMLGEIELVVIVVVVGRLRRDFVIVSLRQLRLMVIISWTFWLIMLIILILLFLLLTLESNIMFSWLLVFFLIEVRVALSLHIHFMCGVTCFHKLIVGFLLICDLWCYVPGFFFVEVVFRGVAALS